MKIKNFRAALLGSFGALCVPVMAFASVESSLTNVQTKLIHTVLPAVGILGLVFAAFSFFTGSQNARSHLILAIMGAVVGFGAPSIIDFVRSLIQ